MGSPAHKIPQKSFHIQKQQKYDFEDEAQLWPGEEQTIILKITTFIKTKSMYNLDNYGLF